MQRPISPACIAVAMEPPLGKDCPSWFLVAEQDRMIDPQTQHFMAARMQALPVDHAPLVTAPGMVTSIILEAVSDVNGAKRESSAGDHAAPQSLFHPGSGLR